MSIIDELDEILQDTAPMTVAELIATLSKFPDQEALVFGCDYPIAGIDTEMSYKGRCVLILNLP